MAASPPQTVTNHRCPGDRSLTVSEKLWSPLAGVCAGTVRIGVTRPPPVRRSDASRE